MEHSAHSTETEEASKLKYYSELNRTTVFLFASLIALMALLLAAGFQKPHKDLSLFMYGAIMSLGINLLVYPLGRFADLRQGGSNRSQGRRTSLFRGAQLALFAISIICLIGLALALSQFFFKAPGA